MNVKFYLLIIFIIHIFIPLPVVAQFSYKWAFTMGDEFTDAVYGMTIDKDGDIYVVGTNSTAFDFDPGEDVTLPNETSSANLFFAKYTKEGDLVFVKSIGTEMNFEFGIRIAVDTFKNIYIAGLIGNNTDMDTGLGESIIETAGSDDAFVAKYDSAGVYIFSFAIKTLSAGALLSIDKKGNIVVFGQFSSTNDFDPGAGEYILDAGNRKPYLAMYSDDADFIYAIAFDTTQSNNEYSQMVITDVAMDASAATYITGYFIGGIDFDPGQAVYPLISVSYSLFMAKYDALGHFVFVEHLAATLEDLVFAPPQIELDENKNIYIASSYLGTIDFDPGPDSMTYTSSSGYDIFFAKYDSSGNFIYVRRLEGTGEFDFVSELKLGENNNIYLTGSFNGTNDFDPGTGTAIHSVSEYADMYLAKYDNAGNYLTSISTGGGFQDFPRGMALDEEGNVYIGGEFYEEFDPDPIGQDLYYTNGYEDMFLVKYGQTLVPVSNPDIYKGAVTVAPNPGTGLFNITLTTAEGSSSVRVADLTGREAAGERTFSGTEVTVDIRHLPAGIYIAIISNDLGQQVVKLVKG
jgi:hypothetical protein